MLVLCDLLDQLEVLLLLLLAEPVDIHVAEDGQDEVTELGEVLDLFVLLGIGKGRAYVVHLVLELGQLLLLVLLENGLERGLACDQLLALQLQRLQPLLGLVLLV